jgi:hypothetical protein
MRVSCFRLPVNLTASSSGWMDKIITITDKISQRLPPRRLNIMDILSRHIAAQMIKIVTGARIYLSNFMTVTETRTIYGRKKLASTVSYRDQFLKRENSPRRLKIKITPTPANGLKPVK